MHILRILGISFCAIVSFTDAQAQQLCRGSQLEDFSLYIYDSASRCWSDVKYLGVGEGTIDLNRDFAGAPKYKKQDPAQFLVAIERNPNYETNVLVKERVFNPREIQGDQSKPRDPRPTDQINLERPGVSNRCGNRSPLRSGASVSLNAYNRYHSSEYIRLSGDLRDFHYSYPRSPTPSCRDTNDFASGNRSQFVFSGFNATSDSLLIAGFPLPSSPRATNSVYRRLTARNLFVQARQPNSPNSPFALIPFQTSAQEFTRSEFTVVDLESKHWPKTWQIEWAP